MSLCGLIQCGPEQVISDFSLVLSKNLHKSYYSTNKQFYASCKYPFINNTNLSYVSCVSRCALAVPLSRSRSPLWISGSALYENLFTRVISHPHPHHAILFLSLFHCWSAVRAVCDVNYFTFICLPTHDVYFVIFTRLTYVLLQKWVSLWVEFEA